MSKIILITCKIEPAILPIAKKPEIIGGIVQGITVPLHNGTKPRFINIEQARYDGNVIKLRNLFF